MFYLIVQTVLLMAIAFILGCIVGCLLRQLFGSAEASAPAVAATATAAAVAAPTPEPVRAPVMPAPPTPTAPVRPVEPAKVETPPAPLVAKKPAAKKTPVKKAPAKKPAVAAKPDNLKLIKGIGPQNEGRLNNMGVSQFAQIAKWSKKEQVDIGEALAFPGRIEREDWVGQAKKLAKGQTTDFAKRVAKGDVGSSVGKASAGDMGKAPGGLLKAARNGKPDNLTLIDGVGGAIEKKMFKLGIFHFDQVAKMTKDELVWLGNSVGFPGRPERENWLGESKMLAKGKMTEHAKRVEKGQIKTSRKS